jgi:Zn finger protein HypA/HybF involved in hydrogenase expression
VVAVANSVFGSPSRLVNYASPQITRLVGCNEGNDTFVLALTDCPRAGSGTTNMIHNDRLTIYGTNFGGEGASVLIGTSQCSDVTHDALTPDELLTCSLPSGTRTLQSVLVIQQNGELSKTSSAVLSYKQCAAGEYETGAVICQSCDIGSFTPVSSQTRCDACSPGSFSNTTATSICETCSSGRYQLLSGQSNCSIALPGEYSTAGAIAARECAAGTYSASNGLSTCDVCAGGTKQTAPGRSSCEICEAGSYSISIAGGITSCDLWYGKK